MTIQNIRDEIARRPARSAWDRGVRKYAAEILDDLDELIEGGYFFADDLNDKERRRSAMLNGASNWNEYSWGGSSLVYDGDIAKRLCTPSELKKTRNGERRPNANEEWLDTQARALRQAANLIDSVARYLQ